MAQSEQLSETANENNKADKKKNPLDAKAQLKFVLECLDDAKAEDIITIDITDKSSIGDYMVVATGRSQRHVGATADRLLKEFKQRGFGRLRVEGESQCDWVLLDSHDVIIHLFRPEVREFYNIEKMWQGDRPVDETA